MLLKNVLILMTIWIIEQEIEIKKQVFGPYLVYLYSDLNYDLNQFIKSFLKYTSQPLNNPYSKNFKLYQIAVD